MPTGTFMNVWFIHPVTLGRCDTHTYCTAATYATHYAPGHTGGFGGAFARDLPATFTQYLFHTPGGGVYRSTTAHRLRGCPLPPVSAFCAYYPALPFARLCFPLLPGTGFVPHGVLPTPVLDVP